MINISIVNLYEVGFATIYSDIFPNTAPETLQQLAEFWAPVVSTAFVLLLLVLFSLFSGLWFINAKKVVSYTDTDLLPPSNFGFRGFFELGWGVIYTTLSSTLGTGWFKHAKLLGSMFFLILVCNLSGLVPGFEPSTAQINFTFGMAFLVFLYFNYVGLKECGFEYIKHLLGPVLWAAPLIFVIEVISLLARPVSLALRLSGNMFGDHMVFSIFSSLMDSAYVPWLPIPAFFIGFGTFVSCLQAYIFMTLGAVYIQIAANSKAH
jgi:F-type H+-transporting ATPase subunit a